MDPISSALSLGYHPVISIIIVSYNTFPMLAGCLRSVYSAGGPRIEVIIVDNASQDGSMQMVRENFPSARLVINKNNLGFAAATKNQGSALLKVATHCC